MGSCLMGKSKNRK